MSFGLKGGGIAALLLIAGMALGASGCGTKQAGPLPTDHRGLQAQSASPGAAIRDPKAVANHLEQLAKSVKGVRGANCVVFGKYAIVGIDVESTLPRSRVGTIKYAVAEAFRKDPYGIDALVTADVDMGQRLREIREDVANGRPVAGFAEEMADIVGRLVPQMPRSVIPPASPDGGSAGLRQTERNPAGTRLPTAGRQPAHEFGGTAGGQPQTNVAPNAAGHAGNVGTAPQMDVRQQTSGMGVAPSGAKRSTGSGGGGGGLFAHGFTAQSTTGGGPHVYEKEWDRARELPTGGNRANRGGGGGGQAARSGLTAQSTTGGGPHVYEKEWDRARELPTGGIRANRGGGGQAARSGLTAQSTTGGGPHVYEMEWDRARELPTGGIRGGSVSGRP